MKNPYQDMPEKAFWRTAVAAKNAQEISALWSPKRDFLQTERIATFGSCFAQHFSSALTARGYNWYDAEPPAAELSAEAARERNYGIFSARTGNIYTSAALRQWVEWALAVRPPPDEVWESGGRYFDPFRPAVEPAGFASPEALFASRDATLRALREVIARTDHFVFTLGLTEAWIHRGAGHVYAMCPGTSAGEFDGAKHAFRNFSHAEILADMRAVVDALRSANERVGVLLTVSPVPLTATASGGHVLTATTYSKSVLRGVAGELADAAPGVDYFPSYEIIAGAPFRARFYEPNLRSVTPEGVRFVMKSFFDCLNGRFGTHSPEAGAAEPVRPGTAPPAGARLPADDRGDVAEEDDAACEESLLAAFAPAPPRAPAAAPRAGAQKICVIGNSHVATLRWALKDGLFADPDLDIVFWAFTRPEFAKVTIRDGVLVPPARRLALIASDGRYETILPREFDVLVFVGCNLNTTASLRSLTERAGDYPAGPGQELFRFFRKQILESQGVKLMTSIAPGYRGRMFFVPAPLASEKTLLFKDLSVSRSELNRFNRFLDRILAQRSITYIAQPFETIKDNKCTRAEFSTDSVSGLRIRAPQVRDSADAMHMNARYGAMILAAVRDRLRQPAAPAPDAGKTVAGVGGSGAKSGI